MLFPWGSNPQEAPPSANGGRKSIVTRVNEFQSLYQRRRVRLRLNFSTSGELCFADHTRIIYLTDRENNGQVVRICDGGDTNIFIFPMADYECIDAGSKTTMHKKGFQNDRDRPAFHYTPVLTHTDMDHAGIGQDSDSDWFNNGREDILEQRRRRPDKKSRRRRFLFILQSKYHANIPSLTITML